MTFANFLVGRGNLLAHAAVRHVAEGRVGSRATCNPLFVYGAKGRGKTHLLQALALDLLMVQRKVRYLSGRDFPERNIRVIEGIDVLIVDDVDLIATSQQRSAFVAQMNEMVDSGLQVVLSAAERPSELSFSEPVKRRIASGLVVELGDLDQDLRLEWLRHNAAAMATTAGISVPDEDLLRALASRLAGSPRDLDAALQRVCTAMQASGKVPSGAEAEALVERVLGALRLTSVQVDRIQSVVARYFGKTRSELLSKSRHSSIVGPRHIAMYLAKELTDYSLPEIGRRFGGRDHTTVLHAVRKIEGLLPKGGEVARQVDEIKRLLLERR